MSSVVTITGIVTDQSGAMGSYSVNVTLNSFTLSAVVTPSVAIAGTTRNLTVTPVGGTVPFIYGTPTGTGLIFTPVSGKPGQWTFVL